MTAEGRYVCKKGNKKARIISEQITVAPRESYGLVEF